MADTADQIPIGHTPAIFGMWIFLATEVMLFGGIFLALLVYRVLHPAAAVETARHLHMWLAAGNTAVLLTSSLTMAVAVTAARVGDHRLIRPMLAATALLGVAFIGIKGFEYHLEFSDGLIPGFTLNPHFREPAALLFLNLYFVATGLHAFHLFIGIALVATASLWRDPPATRIAVVGLYWHFIDIVWLFLYPTLYLTGRGIS